MSSTLAPRHRVPWRTIIASIAVVLATVLVLLALREVGRVLVWLIVGSFFAITLYPVVNWVDERVTRGRRSMATLLVFVVVLLLLGGLITAFAVPMAQQGSGFAKELPRVIDDAQAGRGPLGHLLERSHALSYVQENEQRIDGFVSSLTAPAAGVLHGVATGLVGVLTVFVLSYLMVLQGPVLVDGALNLLHPERRSRVRAVSADCARSITGYLTGNLLISVVCGVLTFLVLMAMEVPFAGLIALFVALADLVPMVGATIGAVVAAVAAALHSIPALIVVLVFMVVYQLVENHVLQPLILARTVRLNPLTVLVAMLVAVDLAGILGAFLAIPVAGMVQVIARDLWDHRRGRPKEQPTVGEDYTPADDHSPRRPRPSD